MPSPTRGPLLLVLLTTLLAAVATATWRVLQGTQARSVPSLARPPAGPPALDLASAQATDPAGELGLGCVEAGERRTAQVLWRRRGEGPLRVLALRTGCGCAALRGLPDLLPAGAQGAAEAVLDVPVDAGPVEVPLRVVTDAPPPGDVVTLRLRAFVGERLVVRPLALDLGRRSPGSRVSARLSVHLPPGAEGPVTLALEGWPGSATLVRAAMHPQHGPDVLLESELGPAAGERVGLLRVGHPHGGTTAVSLRAQVVSDAPSARDHGGRATLQPGTRASGPLDSAPQR